MSLSLEQLTQILAKVGTSSSHKEKILTRVEGLITPPTTNDESTYGEPYIFNKEQLGEQEVEEDNVELQHDLRKTDCAYKSLIERWFQESTRLASFSFSFYFFNLQFQQLISHVYVYFRLSFAKLKEDIFLLLLRAWLHWLFDYT
jgi:hypothetical protein